MPKPQQKTAKSKDREEVVTIKDDQPLNPYTEIQLLTYHTDIIRLLLPVDENRCVSAAADCAVVVWDIQEGRRLQVLLGHTRPVTAMCLLLPNKKNVFADFSTLLLTGSSDKLICLWELESGTCQYTVTDLEAPVKCLVVFPDQELFCAGGENICLWDKSGILQYRFDKAEDEDVHQMIVMKNDMLVAAVHKELVVYSVSKENGDNGEVWGLRRSRRLPQHREAIRSLISVTDESFASGSLDGTVILWAVPSLTPTRYFNSITEYEGPERLYPYSIQHLISVHKHYLLAAVGSGFCVYDINTGKLIAERLHAHYSKVLYFQFVYNGAFLATCSEDGAIRLWGSGETYGNTSPSEVPDNSKESRSQSIIERLLGKSHEEMKVPLSKVVKPKLLGECLGHSGAVQMCADFGGEGFVSCGVDGLVIAWKDGIRQSLHRTEQVHEMLQGSSLAGVV